MGRVWSVDLPNHVGQNVVVAGWLQRLRRLSQVSFLIVRDGRGLVQAVLDNPALIQRVAALPAESVLRLEGEVVSTPQAPRGVELRVQKLEVVSAADEQPPFELHRPEIAAQLPTFLDHAAVGLRHPRHRALFRLAAASVAGFRQTLASEHFVEIFTPKLVATATEGGANVFAVDYFGRPAYLAQSHGRWRGEGAVREHGSDFVFVTGYPLAKRPFYTPPDPSRPGQSNSFDLIFRGLELVTGGQRLHRYADYLSVLAERGQDPAPFAGYLEAFKHGMPPHRGVPRGV